MSLLRILPAEGEGRTTASLEGLLGECGFAEAPGSARTLTRTYCDTQDGRLYQRGLRLYRAAEEARWFLERPGEILADQPGDADNEVPRGPVRKRLRRLCKSRALVVQIGVQAEDRLYLAPGDATPALRLREFTFRDPHEGRVVSGPRILLTTGSLTESTQFLLERLPEATDAPFDPYEVGMAALGIPVPGAPVPATLVIHPRDPLAIAVQKIFARQAHILRANRRGLCLDLDPEYLHQSRVAVRRARSAIKIFRARVRSPRMRTLQADLKRLGASLGRVRDLDVFHAAVRKQLRETDVDPQTEARVLELIAARRRGALVEATAIVGSETFDRLVEVLEHLELTEAGSPLGWQTISRAAPEILDDAVRSVRSWEAREAASLTDEELHRLRIDIKRLRYLGEFFADIQHPSFQKRVMDLVEYQDCLGEGQDAVTAIQFLTSLADAIAKRPKPRPKVLLALGALVQVQSEKRIKRRKRFQKLWEDFPARAEALQRAVGRESDGGHWFDV